MDRTFHTKPTIIASLIGFGTMFFGMCVIAVILERLEGKDPTKLGLVLLTWFVFFPMWLASIYAFFQMVRSIRVDDLGISVTGPKYCFQKTWNEVIRRDIIGSGQDGYILYFRRGLNLELNFQTIRDGSALREFVDAKLVNIQFESPTDYRYQHRKFMLAVSVWLVFALMFAPIAMATTGFPHRFEPSDSVPAVGLAIVSLLLVFGCAYNLSYKLKVLPEGLIAKAITGTRKIQFADVRGIRIYTFQRKDGATEFMELRGDHAFLRLTGRLEGYPVLKSLILEACKGIPIENER